MMDNKHDDDDPWWCSGCDDHQDMAPFEARPWCMQCREHWTQLSSALIARVRNKLEANTPTIIAEKTKKAPQRQQQRRPRQTKSRPKTAKSNVSLRKQPPDQQPQRRQPRVQPPPTKSRRRQKKTTSTNADGNSGNHSKDSSYVTTGAFMTRNTVQKLADPTYGFRPNPHGFCHLQAVEVLNINGHWYPGELTQMKGTKVKVSYTDWKDQEEWIIMGSRRLRIAKKTSNLEDDDDDDEEQEEPVVREDSEKQERIFIQEEQEEIQPREKQTMAEKQKANAKVEEEEEERDPLLPRISNEKTKDDDYVTAMLDTDPDQLFNDNEVFLTRRMAHKLVDDHGFRINSFGYRYNRTVAVLFKGLGKKKSIEYLGYLREMRDNRIRVWIPTLQQSDWLTVGSRRLRLLTAQEEDALKQVEIDLSLERSPPPDAEVQKDSAVVVEQTRPLKSASLTAEDEELSAVTPTLVQEPGKQNEIEEGVAVVANPKTEKRKRGRPRKQPISGTIHTKDCTTNATTTTTSTTTITTTTAATTTTTATAASVVTPPSIAKLRNTGPTVPTFMTTGAFATRRAMRQLQDEHGFVPNPYGYFYLQPIEILNTRTAKNKFWERGHLIAMRPGEVKVRYDGWSDAYDEWYKVGSRRIRPVIDIPSSTTPDGSTAVADETEKESHEGPALPTTGTGSTKNIILSSSLSSDLLCIENNPEVIDELKRNRRRRPHRVLGPEDYAQLGYLIAVEEDPPLEAPVSRRERSKKQPVEPVLDTLPEPADFEAESCSPEPKTERPKRQRQQHQRRRSRPSKRKKTKIEYHLMADLKDDDDDIDDTEDDNDDEDREDAVPTPTVATLVRRGAVLGDDDGHGFKANVYGYDYMQHVQVLHLDKKWYEGRLVRLDRGNRVLIHYCGWPNRFDEYVAVGSRRLQVIQNDHEVECAEPDYQERYEATMAAADVDTLGGKSPVCAATAEHDTAQEPLSASEKYAIMRRNRRRTLSDMVQMDNTGTTTGTGEDGEEEDLTGKVLCHQCNVVIKQFRYYCTYCEASLEERSDIQSFELCLICFDQNFPFWHDHPRSSFAVQAVIDAEIGPMPIKGELVTVWEEDVMDDTAAMGGTASGDGDLATGAGKDNLHNNGKSVATVEEASQVFTGEAAIVTADQGYTFLKRWQRRKMCAFCNDDDDTSEELGKFIGPFVIATFNKNGIERKRQFWAHDACARYSPEVFCTPEGKWYNVTLALRRGRGMRCYACKEKGATIGCFESKCNKSFHLPCAQKPVSYFRNGVIFWCPTHEAYYNKKDTYVNIFKCDGCQKQMEDESWFTCLPCASGYFSSFDLCAECFETLPERNHQHDEDDFEETSFAILKEMEAEKAREVARTKELAAAKRKKPLFPRKPRRRTGDAPITTCCYCGTTEADEWRKGYDGGVIMCRPCFEVALLVDNNDGSNDTNSAVGQLGTDFIYQQEPSNTYVTQIEDYTHKPYLTRDALSVAKFTNTTGIRLSSYEPQSHQLFSLIFDSTYYDIPGRAPRWATHSGTDYHGTWLPQTVRRAILKHTDKDERVLSNFLGRGTDAIECFLLQRRCCGVDINPAAVALSQRNCCFEIPPGLTSAEYRPIIAQADSRHLIGALFSDESFHHILSHPPYKDCVAYSTHLEGDLSRFTNIEEFKREYIKVVNESWRLLKMGRRLTLGIGDNREHCFYIPVGFNLIRQYIDNGFELEELIIKRQRYCSAFGLGTYLCVQFDFLVFTHEFIGTFRKIPRENVDRMLPPALDEAQEAHINVKRISHGVPASAIARKSVVMGTVWVFKPTGEYRFEQLCMSRMVERFGRDDTNWEEIQFEFVSTEEQQQKINLLGNQDPSPLVVDDVNACTTTNNHDDSQDTNALSEYEQQRLKRIEENTRTLVQLGLISELSENSTDVMHYETMMSKPPRPEGPLRLMIASHQPNLQIHQIGLYRQTLMRLALEAVERLPLQGMFIVGTQDIRTADGKLWPMGMLVLEDIERTVSPTILKLKEMVVAVPDGYSKKRHQQEEEQRQTVPTTASGVEAEQHEEDEIVDVVDEHLPIVHAVYLVFQRL
ncbi:hypothetical protein BX666DRAFT_1980104 [Dichotomocladium elegans]|nr:hypothetical protein BX666DRAFT_1980104 [Dichotomocladium elegans]